jgi:AcrR family transcriptional regulator
MVGDGSAARPPVPERRPGRPRDARADEAILAAAGHVLAESGLAGFTVDAVAAQAGVGKATIYRRWPTRSHLLVETAALAAPEIPDADTGSLREDMVIIMRGLRDKFYGTQAGRLMPAVLAEAAVNAEMSDALSGFVCARRERPKAAIRRAVERGELAPDVDVELLLDLMGGPVFVRGLFTGLPISDELVATWVDIVLDGARNRPADG